MFTDASPTYSIAEAARLIGAPAAALSSWTRQKSTKPLVRRFPGRRALSFRSLAEAFVVSVVRKEGVPMQRIRPVLVELAKQIGMEQALASKRLYTDGAEILYDFPGCGYYGEMVNRLVVVRSGRRMFRETVQAYLKRIVYGGAGGYASEIRLDREGVVINPGYGCGRPTFSSCGALVESVLRQLDGGDPIEELEDDFGIPADTIKGVAAHPRPAWALYRS